MSGDLNSNDFSLQVARRKEKIKEDQKSAVACIDKRVKNKKHQRTIKQALGLIPYKGQGKNSKWNSASTKRTVK